MLFSSWYSSVERLYSFIGPATKTELADRPGMGFGALRNQPLGFSLNDRLQ